MSNFLEGPGDSLADDIPSVKSDGSAEDPSDALADDFAWAKPNGTEIVRTSFARLFAAGTEEWVVNSLAIVALCVGLIDGRVWLAVLMGGAVLLISVLFRIPIFPGAIISNPAGKFVLSRVLIVLLAAAIFDGESPELSDQGVNVWVTAALIAVLIVSEELVTRVMNAARPVAIHLPGVDVRNAPLFTSQYIFCINVAAILVFAGLAAYGVPSSWFMVLVAVAAVPTLVLLVDSVWRFFAARRVSPRLPEILAEWGPEFVVYWDAPRGTEFQLGMWLPHLESLNRRFMVILRNAKTVESIAELTRMPVVYRRRSNDLDEVVVPTLRAAFYVNNAMRNSHFVRYPQLIHVQLNHGDSEKAPSYNPVTRMFDKNFVAGQAAVDRFAAHGVHIPEDFCQIVGRPQVAGIEVGPRSGDDSSSPVILYAPTWRGHNDDSAYSSLDIGPKIVQGLLDRSCTVLFRPHPYTDRDPSHAHCAEQIRMMLASDAETTGRSHVWSSTIAEESTIIENFNAADGLVSDISSVVSDFLYSEKPLALTVMQGTIEESLDSLPMASAAHLIAGDLSTLDSSLDALIGADAHYEERKRVKDYYLGDFPADQYPEAFAEAVRALLKPEH